MLAALPAVLAFTAAFSNAEIPKPLKISENGRYLVQRDGQPFFYLADTAWELFHRLNREEAERYLTNRAEKGFTVIQAVVIGELEGLTTGNAYGDTPFVDMDGSRPNEKYFAHVDWIVEQAATRGLYIAMLPAWGRWVGTSSAVPVQDNFLHEGNSRAYGRFLAERYHDKPVIWVLGGDCLPARGLAAWNEMAAGIREVVGKNQLMTYHSSVGTTTELDAIEWIDFYMHQSAHYVDSINYDAMARYYALKPVKPCIDAEPAYEFPPDAMPPGIPVGALQIRRLAYWGLFSGAHGHAYGTHPIWQMYDTGRDPLWYVSTPWHQAMDLPGANQLAYVKRLILSRPYLTRIPDQGVITSENPGGIEHMQATRDGSLGANDATYLMVYFPRHHRVTINTAVIAGGTLKVAWFNTRSGESTDMGEVANSGTAEFEPPTNVDGEDWVLMVDDASKDYAAP